jgi:hypothetical protein
MRRFIILALLVTACGRDIVVPIDPSPIAADKATIIIYHDQGFTDEFKIFLDKNKVVGTVTAEKPLKFSVHPGEHQLHTEVDMVVDRVHKQIYEPGKVYFMKLWLDIGMWVSSIRITPASPIAQYKTVTHRD